MERLTQNWVGNRKFQEEEDDPTPGTVDDGHGTDDRSFGVIDWLCVVGKWIMMHVVPEEVPCLLIKGWLKENGAVIDTQAGKLRLA